jgi:uncharacterized protein
MEEGAGLPDQSLLQVEILVANTWRCNLNCSYCFVRNHELAVVSEQMSSKTAIKIIDLLDLVLVNAETICIHFYGGEPLINLTAIEAMVNRARQIKPGRFNFAVTTNGFISDPSVYKILNDGNFQIILSIDGPEKVHDECRRTIYGDPTHATVLQFLKNVRKFTHCRVRGSSVVRSGWSLKNAIGYLSSLPLDTVKAQAVRAKPGIPNTLTYEEKLEYLKDLEDIGKNVISEIEAGRIPKDDRYSNRVLQLLAGRKRESFCGAGNSTFGITPNGIILPCILMDEKKEALGHINDNKAEWIHQGVRWRDLHNVRSSCHACGALDLCGGGCYAILPICGEDECEIVRKNCEVATLIYEHFKTKPEKLLILAGIM